jgi:hypothetical protein
VPKYEQGRVTPSSPILTAFADPYASAVGDLPDEVISAS